MKKWLLAVIVAFLLMSTVTAQDFVRIDDEIQGYFVSVEYSPKDVKAGVPVAFSITFLDKDTREQAPLDHIWVRISDKEEENIYSAGAYVKESEADQDIDFIYTFQKSGDYQVYMRFHKDGTLVHQVVYISVAMSQQERTMWILIVIALLLLVYSLYWAKHHYHLVRESDKKRRKKR